jgi:uncharacterized protein (DUF1015 family)
MVYLGCVEMPMREAASRRVDLPAPLEQLTLESMAHIRSFPAIHFNKTRFADLSNLIAPPFDVLDQPAKAALQAKHPNNIVNIDLPHIPPKAAGPAEVYTQSAMTLQAWLDSGILVREKRTAFYPYMQNYDHLGRTVHRRGFFALVRLSPFGQGQVVPHEKTYKGAIEDRLALMRATSCQLSPIFGLFNDKGNEITNLLYANLSRPDFTGSFDGVKHDLWKLSDPDLENRVSDMMPTGTIGIPPPWRIRRSRSKLTAADLCPPIIPPISACSRSSA